LKYGTSLRRAFQLRAASTRTKRSPVSQRDQVKSMNGNVIDGSAVLFCLFPNTTRRPAP